MAAARGHRECVAGTIHPLLSLRDDRHCALENQQTGIEVVDVLGVDRIGFHAAIHDFAVTLVAQFGLERCPVHRSLLMLLDIA